MIKNLLKNITLVACTLSIVGVLHAQPIADPIVGVSKTLSGIDALIVDGGVTKLLDEVSLATSEQVESGDIEAWESAQKRGYAAETGLAFRVGYDHKFGEGADDIYDDLYSYRHRFDAMLSWNILQSGLVGRSSNAQQVELEAQKLVVAERSLLNRETIREHSQKQEQVLNGYRNKIYRTQIELYTSLATLLDKLRSQGQATTMEQIEIEMKAEIAKSAICETPIVVSHLFSLSDYLTMQVMVDARMIEELAIGSAAVESRRIDEQLTHNEASNVSYWKGVSVSPYAKAQHYSDIAFAESRVTANVGVSATFPLFSGTKSRRAEVQARSTLASNATASAATATTMVIEETARELNKNLALLTAAAKLEKIYLDQILKAQEAYTHKQVTMQELAQYYLKYLTFHSEIIDHIDDRESLKTKLLQATI